MSYHRQAASALRILSSRGVTVTLTRSAPGKRDPVAQTATPAGKTSQSIVVAILPASEGRDLSLDDRSLVRKNRRSLIIAGRKPDGSPLAFDPEDGHTLPFENDTWRLASVSRLAPDGGAPVLFMAEARR